MTSRSPSARPLIARGRYTNLLLFLALVVGGYVGFVFLSPRITAYEAKTAVKSGCSEYMRSVVLDVNNDDWKRGFESRMKRIGVPLRGDQYRFDLNPSCGKAKCSCHGQAAFALSTEWPVLQDFFGDMAPYRSVHRVDVKVDYLSEY